MEQFRQIGEVLGSIRALIVLQDDNQINKRQCYLLFDIFNMAFDTLSVEIKQNLKLEERNMKWKPLEQPLKELHRVFQDGEVYVKQCMDSKEWWVKAITYHNNRDCVESHIHNLLCYFPIIIESIETAGEISGLDIDEMKKKRIMLSNKYDKTWNDPKLFHWKYGKQYLISEEICHKMNNAHKEDQWLLQELIKEKKTSPLHTLSKQEHRLGELLTKKFNRVDSLYPTTVLTGAKDYQVRRRLGGGMQYKEILWLGESYALRHFFGEPTTKNILNTEIYTLLSLSHPNVVQYLCGFNDEEKNEYLLVMELISKDLSSYIKEVCSLKRQLQFSLPAAVDIMLQISRGMEYLHSQKICHGELKPSNILIKPKTSSLEGYFTAKITGFGLKNVKAVSSRGSTPSNQTETLPFIWYAPEVLSEQERPGSSCKNKFSEKADVYSFGMLCFELLTGKVPFEDGHLQGDKMSRNIRAGERPLFPFALPKYLAGLTKRCWQTDPSQRPSFSSICRILRYVKRLIVLNPHLAHPEIPSIIQVDFCEIESGFMKKFQVEGTVDVTPVSRIPFELFSYRLFEKEKLNSSIRDNNWDSQSEVVLSTNNIEDNANIQDGGISVVRDTRSVCSDIPDNRHLSFRKVKGDQFLGRRDILSVCSEIPEKKVRSLKKSTSIDAFYSSSLRQRPVWTERTPEKKSSPLKKCNTIPYTQGCDTRSVCSEIPEKRGPPDKKFPYLRKYNSVRASKEQGKTLGQRKGPSSLNPLGQRTKTLSEKQASTSHRICGCKHRHAGHLTDSEIH